MAAIGQIDSERNSDRARSLILNHIFGKVEPAQSAMAGEGRHIWEIEIGGFGNSSISSHLVITRVATALPTTLVDSTSGATIILISFSKNIGEQFEKARNLPCLLSVAADPCQERYSVSGDEPSEKPPGLIR
ncbi:MAG: hypothetical protein U5J78_02725 [Parasphingorhabdus sp.]|nr:hypothetical protein [Parasphingorhabdus sp.]